MPYATPTSPIPSPVKESIPSSSRKARHSPPTHVKDIDFAGPSRAIGPMPGIPRRSSSSTNSNSDTPRRGMSPTVSRHTGGTRMTPASRPMEGLPRRRTSSGQGSTIVSGLPAASGEGSLGLKLHPSPRKAPSMQRGLKDSISSTVAAESSLPSTPWDEPQELPLPPISRKHDDETPTTATVPFPTFEPPSCPPVQNAHRATSQPPPPRLNIQAVRRGSGLGHHRGNGQTGSLQLPFPTSASTSQLHTSSPAPDIHAAQSLRPISSMIRKKSGEVVKPSLKIRSMSTPDLTRQLDGSEPSSPESERNRGFPDERSKSVRFADADGGEAHGALESVVLFLREQKVTAIGKAADPNGQMTETETENDTDPSDFVQFRTRRNAAARAADEAAQIVLEGGSRVPRIRTDFAPDARGSLRGEHVVLERIELVANSGPLNLRGTVIVRNVAFQKWVAVRFTMDHWQTRSEVSGIHVCHIPSSTTGDEGWDRFGFAIKLEDFKRKLEERQLIMCVRFSIEGQEWWDSNNEINYNFTFKKVAPRRLTRASGPASYGGGFMRAHDEEPSPSLPGLRSRSAAPGENFNRAFGVKPEVAKSTGPKNWVFPKLVAHINDGPARPDSPVGSISAAAYTVPAPPDVHTHLSLSKYCAPSPPQSPPKEGSFQISTSEGANPVVVSPADSASSSPEKLATVDLNVLGGQLATLSPSKSSAQHERRSSWNGNNGSWDSFTKVMEHVDGSDGEAAYPQVSTDGESTPVATGARSPARMHSATSSDSSPERPSLSLKRSTGDLRALLDVADDGTGLITPPPSNLSSPPSPVLRALIAVPMSPSTNSAASTGESSPVNTVSSDSATDLTDITNLSIDDIDPSTRGRSATPTYKMLNNSYQEFLDKFCFFQSPRMTPNEEPVHTRPTYIPLSGTSSPTGFPFFATNSSNSPRATPTPTRQYDSASDAFNFVNAIAANGGASSTPRPSPPNMTPTLGNQLDARTWAKPTHGTNSQSIAIAK